MSSTRTSALAAFAALALACSPSVPDDTFSCDVTADCVAEIGAGFQHSCVALTSGGARCWGGNTDGRLGNGTAMESLLPVVVLPP